MRQKIARLFRRTESDFIRLAKAGRITVGKHSYGNPSIRIFEHDQTRLTVGSYTSIAHDVQFLLGGNHPTERITTFPLRIRLGLDGAGEDGYPSSRGDIVVGSDVWIGARTTVLSGVTIGDGAVVGAGSLVSRDIPPYSICVGQPAKPVGSRIPEEFIGPMLEIKWWEWDDLTVEDSVAELSGSDLGAFVARHSRNPRLESRPAS
ncbi:acetyltransferase-like isoleucine patch superfamily enzyme [Arthrobacter sp. UYNi723]